MLCPSLALYTLQLRRHGRSTGSSLSLRFAQCSLAFFSSLLSSSWVSPFRQNIRLSPSDLLTTYFCSSTLPNTSQSSWSPSAYLTNPSESSFRSFLTEQSFRQHLSRLDDVSDDVDVLREYNSDSALSTTSRKQVNSPKRSPYVNASSCGSYTALRFSGRASVSLRTPKHVFRSFGILSIAAIVPSAKRKGHRLLCLSDTGRSRDNIESPNGTSGMASVETWFIGAFGMWWLVAHYDGFWHEAGIASKDEDGTPTGLLDAKSLDHISDISRKCLISLSCQRFYVCSCICLLHLFPILSLLPADSLF